MRYYQWLRDINRISKDIETLLAHDVPLFITTCKHEFSLNFLWCVFAFMLCYASSLQCCSGAMIWRQEASIWSVCVLVKIVLYALSLLHRHNCTWSSVSIPFSLLKQSIFIRPWHNFKLFVNHGYIIRQVVSWYSFVAVCCSTGIVIRKLINKFIIHLYPYVEQHAIHDHWLH